MSDQKRQWTGTWIPRQIWECETLTWLEKCLWAEISNLDDGRGCFASNDYLAEKMGSSSASIANMISKFRKLGLIVDAGFDGRRRYVRAVNPALTQPLTLPSPPSEPSVNSAVNIDNSGENTLELISHTAAPDGPAKVKAAPKPREPNVLLEALASVGGANPRETPPSRWSALQKYLREIKSVTPEVTPEEINRRVVAYRNKYTTAAVTPDALAKHWGEFTRTETTVRVRVGL